MQTNPLKTPLCLQLHFNCPPPPSAPPDQATHLHQKQWHHKHGLMQVPWLHHSRAQVWEVRTQLMLSRHAASVRQQRQLAGVLLHSVPHGAASECKCCMVPGLQCRQQGVVEDTWNTFQEFRQVKYVPSVCRGPVGGIHGALLSPPVSTAGARCEIQADAVS
jgi:hypothetical protein